MKAQLADNATGIINRRGSSAAATAVAAAIGMRMLVVAVLLVASVRKVTVAHNTSITSSG